MPILVRFERNGFYHPAVGRLGMGANAGKIYSLPDEFREDGMLPKSTEILDDVDEEILEEVLEEAGQTRVDKPKLDRAELERAVAAAKGQSKAAKRKAGIKTVGEAKAKKAPAPATSPEPTTEAKPKRSRRAATAEE